MDWNPQLPTGVQESVILVNEAEPTSAISYTLCSQQYTADLTTQITQAGVILSEVSPFTKAKPDEFRDYLKLLRTPTRTDIRHEFGGEFDQKKFRCRAYFAMQFYALRQIYLGTDKLFVESLNRCQTWASSGGKSGASFMKTLVRGNLRPPFRHKISRF